MNRQGHLYAQIEGDEYTHATYHHEGLDTLCKPYEVSPATAARRVSAEGEVTCPRCKNVLKRNWRKFIVSGEATRANAKIKYYDFEERTWVTLSDIEYVAQPSGYFVRFWMTGGRFPRKCFYRLARLVRMLAGGNAYVYWYSLPKSGQGGLN